MCYRGLLVAAGRVCNAGVKVVKTDPESLAALQVVEKGVVGLLCACFVGVRKVDEIATMRDDMLRLIVRMRLAIIVERCADVFC